MLIKQFFESIWRLYIKKSGSQSMVKYLRRKGVKIGKNCRLHTISFSTEPYLVEIGDDVSIADCTVFITHDGSITCFRADFPGDDIFGRIRIGNNVTIGAHTIILPNTTIGNNSIVGAGSVVRGIFPDDSVIVGNPAKTVLSMNAQKLLFSQNPGRLRTRNMTDAEKKPIVIKHFSNMK
jgi:acetyltransferase-like isoleucine patch superfamily enzyme